MCLNMHQNGIGSVKMNILEYQNVDVNIYAMLWNVAHKRWRNSTGIKSGTGLKSCCKKLKQSSILLWRANEEYCWAYNRWRQIYIELQ